jgi:hypothetical protein
MSEMKRIYNESVSMNLCIMNDVFALIICKCLSSAFFILYLPSGVYLL